MSDRVICLLVAFPILVAAVAFCVRTINRPWIAGK